MNNGFNRLHICTLNVKIRSLSSTIFYLRKTYVSKVVIVKIISALLIVCPSPYRGASTINEHGLKSNLQRFQNRELEVDGPGIRHSP